MKPNRRIILAIAVVIAALAAGGAGIAQAVGGGSEQPVTGPAAEQAKAAALEAAGGGTVTEIEGQDDDGAGVYEVEVRRADGTQVEIHLDAQFQEVGRAADDDTGSESEDESGEDPARTTERRATRVAGTRGVGFPAPLSHLDLMSTATMQACGSWWSRMT